MIEIIKRGTKHTTVCAECGCKFSYEDEDVLNDVVEKLLKEQDGNSKK
jgi:hypothetical protein